MFCSNGSSRDFYWIPTGLYWIPTRFLLDSYWISTGFLLVPTGFLLVPTGFNRESTGSLLVLYWSSTGSSRKNSTGFVLVSVSLSILKTLKPVET